MQSDVVRIDAECSAGRNENTGSAQAVTGEQLIEDNAVTNAAPVTQAGNMRNRVNVDVAQVAAMLNCRLADELNAVEDGVNSVCNVYYDQGWKAGTRWAAEHADPFTLRSLVESRMSFSKLREAVSDPDMLDKQRKALQAAERRLVKNALCPFSPPGTHRQRAQQTGESDFDAGFVDAAIAVYQAVEHRLLFHLA